MKTLVFPEAAEQVKASLDIVDIVSRHVVLKKAGRNYTGLCPFHPEKSPSFNVNREKNLFKCFGCGEGGDALTFLMKRENKTFAEVIKDLAAEQGIEILQEHRSKEHLGQQQQQKELTQKIYEVNQQSLSWFSQQLSSDMGLPTRQYLEHRQIPISMAQQFHLGYAPEGWDHLTKHFSHLESFDPQLLVSAGLTNSRENGSGFYDRFRNRLIIPIHDEMGRVVGFGGRALSDEDKPKYLNSPETPVYFKNRVLYGLYQAKEAIRQSHSVVVMEGYFDVISSHMAGIPQAVGACGTALTENHLKLLTRFGAETVYLAFDSDEAGLKAALSAIELIEPYVSTANLSLKVVIVPNGKDPDEFIREHAVQDWKEGGNAFQSLLPKAQPFLEFQFDMAIRTLNLQTPEGRVSAAAKITPLLAKIRHPLLRGEYQRKYAERLLISEEALRLEVKQYEQGSIAQNTQKYTSNYSSFDAISKRPPTSYKSNNQRAGKNNSPRPLFPPFGLDNPSDLRKPLIPRHLAAEKTLLKLLFLNIESYRIMLQHLPTMKFQEESHQAILTAVCHLQEASLKEFDLRDYRESLEGVIQRLNEGFSDQPDLQRLLAELVLTSETAGKQFGLHALSSGLFETKLRKVVEDYRQTLDEDRQQKGRRELLQKTKFLEQSSREGVSQYNVSKVAYTSNEDDEGDIPILEIQYQLRESLTQQSKDLLKEN